MIAPFFVCIIVGASITLKELNCSVNLILLIKQKGLHGDFASFMQFLMH